MEDNHLKESVELMLKGLNGIVSQAEKSTKGMFENMGKAEAKKFAKTMKAMNFNENILNLKSEVEVLKKTFKQMENASKNK